MVRCPRRLAPAIGVAIAGSAQDEDGALRRRDVPGDVLALEARNLVVGPDGPGYGDVDGDGSLAGEVERGLLPGLAGETGLTGPGADERECLVPDLLGGSWADPAARWAEATDAIAAWSETDNTFPSLASHAQRIVGWASLTLASGDLATAVEFAGHARLHVDVVADAAASCG